MPGAAAASDLALVRRYEAAGFRAWPAGVVHYDGTWVVRLTPGHPAKRLNSVNPLDPRDTARVAERIVRVGAEFARAGRALTFRLSPLCGDTLGHYLDAAGWSRFSESVVMEAGLTAALVKDAMDHIPTRDVGRFMQSVKPVHGMNDETAAGLAGVLSAVTPNLGLFALERENAPLATAVCVQDNDLAGLFEVATAEAERGMGHGRRAILAALRWARLNGARRAWLQVEADNHVAIGLYRSLGFSEVYRYHYRRPPKVAS